ncbi:hypothetical protein AM2_0699 [Lactococcus cremoris]|nr:hypothetical protein SK110_1519 [Lactococcus cremoris]KZK54565.1 hypothetical protein AM2_0699 [Lactococcus cremoris]
MSSDIVMKFTKKTHQTFRNRFISKGFRQKNIANPFKDLAIFFCLI